MPLIRIEAVRNERAGLYHVEIYYPSDAGQPIVTTEARYKTAAAAENDTIAIIAAYANSPRPNE
jgi:hypothetical protein